MSSSRVDWARQKYHDEFEDSWSDAREKAPAPVSGHLFENGSRKAQRIQGKEQGDAGYGQRLSDASSEAVEHGKAADTVIAVPATAVLDRLEAGIKEQATAAGRLRNEGGPVWLTAKNHYAADWATENQTALMRYQFEQSSACTAFNAWCPFANASRAAMNEIIEAARLLGFDLSKEKDAASFVMSIESGLASANELVDVRMLGRDGRQSWSSRNDDPATRSSARPQLEGAELSLRLQDLTASYRDVQAAYTRVYEALLKDREAALRVESTSVRSRLTQIEGVIAFWSSASDFVVGAVSGTRGIVDGSAAKGLGAQAGMGAIGPGKSVDRAQKAAQRFETKGGTEHLTQYDRHMAEADAHFPRDAKEGATATAGVSDAVASSAPSASVALPSLSVGGIVQFGLKLMYSAELDELNRRISAIESQAAGTAAAIVFVNTHGAVKTYQAASARMAEQAKSLDAHGLPERQQDIRQLGHELDSFAVEHASKLRAGGKAGLVPGAGKETHGTTMAIVAKIEQYRALSTMSLKTFDYDGTVAAARAQQLERSGMRRPRESAARNPDLAHEQPPRLPPMGAEETSVYQHMAGTYLRVLQEDERWRMRLARVEEQLQALLKKLSGSASSPHAVGRSF